MRPIRSRPFFHLMILGVVFLMLGACTQPLPGAVSGEDAQAGSAPAEESSPSQTGGPTDTENEESQADAESDPAESQTSESQSAESEDAQMYKGVEVGFTAEGYPYRGSPDAPLTIYEYSDYQCPFCARHVIQTEPALLSSFVEEGKVRFVFRDFPLEAIHPNAIPASIAANCVAEQGIVPFWQYHETLFRTQEEWGTLGDPTDFFAVQAAEIGADMTAFQACYADSAEQQAFVEASLAEGEALDFTGTPSFNFVTDEGDNFTLVGAQPYTVFADYVETIAAGGTPEDPSQAQRQQTEQGDGGIPYWATAEGLAPDPDNPGMTIAGDYYRGDPEAPMVVVEFSDFQCPFCQRHTLQTQPVLDEEFVDSGEVMWVFKHFPVQSTHPQAVSAALASECAGQQEAFWPMHDLLFETMSNWSNSGVDEYMLDLAGQLGLDVDALAACMDAPETSEAVQEDLLEGSAFVRGTPTFVVLFEGQGRLIPGALPADQFVPALRQMMGQEEGQN